MLERPLQEESDAVRERVEAIIEQVRQEGDRALKELAERFDGATFRNLKVCEGELGACEGEIDETLKQAIRIAKENIETFHSAQRMEPLRSETMPGVWCEQRSVPIPKVGLYIPGGSAPLFSTVLMLAIPARIAGCREIVLCTPPGPTGRIAPEILWTAKLCGIDKVYKVGGAQAIAAMAYGTETVPRVDKIFGPGNRYVTSAKQLLGLTRVAIDMPAGPSEVMVLGDETARAAFVASDLLSQAEHGADSQAILVTTSERLARETTEEVRIQLEKLPRKDKAAKALEESRIIVVKDEKEMIDIANLYAAEHLIVETADPEAIALRIENAGSIFLGHYSPESVGDYASGTNHTLPTSGWATTYSGVNLDSFCKKITFQKLTEAGFRNIGPTVERMAEAEGLDAHKNAVTIRLNELK